MIKGGASSSFTALRTCASIASMPVNEKNSSLTIPTPVYNTIGSSSGPNSVGNCRINKFTNLNYCMSTIILNCVSNAIWCILKWCDTITQIFSGDKDLEISSFLSILTIISQHQKPFKIHS